MLLQVSFPIVHACLPCPQSGLRVPVWSLCICFPCSKGHSRLMSWTLLTAVVGRSIKEASRGSSSASLSSSTFSGPRIPVLPRSCGFIRGKCCPGRPVWLCVAGLDSIDVVLVVGVCGPLVILSSGGFSRTDLFMVVLRICCPWSPRAHGKIGC